MAEPNRTGPSAPERPAPFGRGRIRRLVGLDRSGPEPDSTRSGQPWRPWTVPNAVGYLRLAGLPVFLVLVFNSGDGQSTAAALVYWAIAAGDYLDGLLARVTGQYSRLGALMDPVIDRLTILAGAAACWHFNLLPRWALALLVLREVVTLLLAQSGLRKGIDISVNWAGRIAVFPIMGALFLALLATGLVADLLLVSGLVMAWIATLLYARSGRRLLRAQEAASRRPADRNIQL